VPTRLDGRVTAALATTLTWPAVAVGRRVVASYGAAGGGLLAGGLAYSALFALVPALFLASGVLGLVVADPARRAEAVAFIATALPPLRDLVEAVLAEAGRDAGALSLVGAATLAWGASRFVLSFGDAIDRVVGRPRRRGVVRRNVGAFGAVLLLVVAIVVGAVLAGIASFMTAAEGVGLIAVAGPALRLVLDLGPPVLTALAVALVYRIVPTPRPGWRALGLPAAVVGVALIVLIDVFVFLAPRLIGAAALLGTIATVFAALAWLSLSFQAILLGAAWVGERDAASRPGQ
jgi:membrane protein